MTVINEEAIYAALAERMEEVTWLREGDVTVYRFVEASRKVKLFSDLDQATQNPACYQAEWASDEQQVSNMAYKTTLQANWIIYQSVGGPTRDGIGAIENNLILGGVREVLAPRPGDPGFPDERNTLGGLVYHCFISGRIFKDPGDIDGQGMMVVPIKLLIP